MDRTPNKITGANAGGPLQLPIRMRWAPHFRGLARTRRDSRQTQFSEGAGLDLSGSMQWRRHY